MTTCYQVINKLHFNFYFSLTHLCGNRTQLSISVTATKTSEDSKELARTLNEVDMVSKWTWHPWFQEYVLGSVTVPDRLN